MKQAAQTAAQAKQTAAEKDAALRQAQRDEQEAKQTYDAAKEVYDAKEEAVTQAQTAYTGAVNLQNAQKAAAEAEQALAELTAGMDQYDAQCQEQINAIIEQAKADMAAAVTPEEVQTIRTEAERQINALINPGTQPELISLAAAKISKTSLTYTGKELKPAVTVTAVVDGQTATLTKDTDYTVTYKNNKSVGKASVTVEGIGSYTGKLTKTFKIVPKKTKLLKVTAAKKAFTAKWKKQAVQTSGYQLQYSLKKTFKGAKLVTISGGKKISRKVTKLKSKKIYYVRVRTFKKVGSTKYVSLWSNVKKVKVK